jgi:hypothetical protein
LPACRAFSGNTHINWIPVVGGSLLCVTIMVTCPGAGAGLGRVWLTPTWRGLPVTSGKERQRKAALTGAPWIMEPGLAAPPG